MKKGVVAIVGAVTLTISTVAVGAILATSAQSSDKPELTQEQQIAIYHVKGFPEADKPTLTIAELIAIYEAKGYPETK